MISEIGRVTKSDAGKVLVALEKRSACAKCHVGCACDIEKSVMMIEANDPIGVRKDQTVQVSIPTDSAVQASFVVYGIPLLALIVGVLLGEHIGKILGMGVNELPAIFGGFFLLGLSLLFVKFYDNIFRQKRRNQPVITKVIE